MLELPVDDADRFARFMVTEFRSNGESVVVAQVQDFMQILRTGCEVRLAAVIHEDKIRRAIQIIGEGLAAYQDASERHLRVSNPKLTSWTRRNHVHEQYATYRKHVDIPVVGQPRWF